VDVDDVVFEDVCEEVELTKTGPEGVKKTSPYGVDIPP